MERTLLSIVSGAVTYYFDSSDRSGSPKVELHRDEHFLKSFDTLGQAFEYFMEKIKPSTLYIHK